MALKPPNGHGRSHDNRTAQRFPTRFPAQLKLRAQLIPVIVRDISQIGAMIEGEGLPEAGRHAMLLARRTEVEARIIWHKEGLAGLAFIKLVDPLAMVRDNIDLASRSRRRADDQD